MSKNHGEKPRRFADPDTRLTRVEQGIERIRERKTTGSKTAAERKTNPRLRRARRPGALRHLAAGPHPFGGRKALRNRPEEQRTVVDWWSSSLRRVGD